MAKAALRTTAQRLFTTAYGLANRLGNRQPGNRILMYHAVGTPISDDHRGFYTISPRLFEAHMAHLATSHRSSLSALSEKMLDAPDNRIAITFDDGYADNLHCAAPILEKLGIPFTVFVIANAVASGTAGFLTPADLRQLAASPLVSIGSHGMTHKRLAECSDKELHYELDGSKQYLEDIIGREVSMLSYPHGSVDTRVTDFAARAGYRLGACSRFSGNGPDCNRLMLARTDIWAGDSTAVLEEKLGGSWDWLKWR